MKRILHLLLLSLTLSIGGRLMAQAPFFQDLSSEAAVIPSNASGQSGAITNHYLRTLASANNQGIDKIRLIVAFEKNLKLTNKGNRQMQVYAALNRLGIEGDVQYLGFNLEEYLKPSAMSFRLRVQKGEPGTIDLVEQVFDFADVGINGNPAVLASFNATDSTANLTSSKLVMDNLKFVFRQADKNRFDARIALIGEYASASSELENIYNELLNVHPEDLDGLEGQRQRLQNLSQRIQGIAGRNFEQQLLLSPSQDPANFVPRLNDAQRLSQQLGVQVDEAFAALPALYHERALGHLAQGRRQQAIRDFNRSIDLDPNFAPAHLELANIALQDGNVSDARSRLINILTQMNAAPRTRTQAAGMLKGILDQDLNAARGMIQQGNFEQALSTVNPLAPLCADVQELNCVGEINDLMGQAHRGIYQRMLGVCRTHLNSGQFELAEQKAQEAMAYQASNSAFIPDGGAAVQALNESRRKLYLQLVREGSQMLEQGQLGPAEAKINQALTLGAQHPEAVSSTSDAAQLMNRIKAGQYQSQIVIGDQAMQGRQFQNALAAFENARVMEQEYVFQKNPGLWGMAQAAAKQVVKLGLLEAKQAAQMNQLAAARQKAMAASALRSKYDLGADGELQNLTADLQGSIFNQECVNAQSKFDGFTSQAASMVAGGRFVEAEGFFLQAIGVSRENQACGIDLIEVDQELKRITPAVAYQKELAQAHELIDRTRYREAIQSYENAGQGFERNQLAQMGLAHQNLFDFIIGKGRNGFIHYGADHFIDAGELDNSLELVRLMARRGMAKSRMKPVQLRLGAELAIRDFESNASANPKTMAAKYTRGNKKLKFIYKGYKKQWKRLK